MKITLRLCWEIEHGGKQYTRWDKDTWINENGWTVDRGARETLEELFQVTHCREMFR